MAKAENKEADSQRLRLQSVEVVRLDPLGFVRWAFPWGNGPLAGHDGPEARQMDVLGNIGRQLRANAHGKKVRPRPHRCRIRSQCRQVHNNLPLLRHRPASHGAIGLDSRR